MMRRNTSVVIKRAVSAAYLRNCSTSTGSSSSIPTQHQQQQHTSLAPELSENARPPQRTREGSPARPMSAPSTASLPASFQRASLPVTQMPPAAVTTQETATAKLEEPQYRFKKHTAYGVFMRKPHPELRGLKAGARSRAMGRLFKALSNSEYAALVKEAKALAPMKILIKNKNVKKVAPHIRGAAYSVFVKSLRNHPELKNMQGNKRMKLIAKKWRDLDPVRRQKVFEAYQIGIANNTKVVVAADVEKPLKVPRACGAKDRYEVRGAYKALILDVKMNPQNYPTYQASSNFAETGLALATIYRAMTREEKQALVERCKPLMEMTAAKNSSRKQAAKSATPVPGAWAKLLRLVKAYPQLIAKLPDQTRDPVAYVKAVAAYYHSLSMEQLMKIRDGKMHVENIAGRKMPSLSSSEEEEETPSKASTPTTSEQQQEQKEPETSTD